MSSASTSSHFSNRSERKREPSRSATSCSSRAARSSSRDLAGLLERVVDALQLVAGVATVLEHVVAQRGEVLGARRRRAARGPVRAARRTRRRVPCAPARAPSMPRSRSTAVPVCAVADHSANAVHAAARSSSAAGGTSPARTKRSRCCAQLGTQRVELRVGLGRGGSRPSASTRARVSLAHACRPGAPRASRRCASSAPAIVAASGNAR